MAFDKSLWTRQTLAFNSGKIVAQDGMPENGPAIFTYYNLSDTLAQITTANYFAPQVFDLNMLDVIWCQGSDANGFYTVTALNKAAGTVSLTAQSAGSGAVTPEDVQSNVFNIGVDSGTADNYIITLDPPLTAYTEGTYILFSSINQNTVSNPQLNVDGLGSIGIGLMDSSSLVPGDIGAGISIVYIAAGPSAVLLNPFNSSITPRKIQEGVLGYYSDTGATDAYVIGNSTFPNTNSFNPGAIIAFNPSSNNTIGNPTVSANGSTTYPITNMDGTNLVPDDIQNGFLALIYKDSGSNFSLINPRISSPTASLVQSNSYNKSTDSGAADAYVITLVPAPASLVNGMQVSFVPANANATTTPTLNVNGFGTYDIVLSNGAVAAGDIDPSMTAVCVFAPGNKWVLLTPVVS